MTIADKLEALLPADGNYTTKDERVIAEAVRELRHQAVILERAKRTARLAWERIDRMEASDPWKVAALAFILGIAATLAAGWVLA